MRPSRVPGASGRASSSAAALLPCNVSIAFRASRRSSLPSPVLPTTSSRPSERAVAIDHENWPEIAGDDTILVVAPDTFTADTLRARLLALLAE